ncbi:hypothetical protein [Rhodospira trueperi]|uniref:Uncharacterized protein n=1 Tax=Rhodospira trueperi TaxID=69960 RepID=A0A1G7BN68_9PROT|nr:hypothetical protein [Rhodospira trueperi]SDE28578.1 hypothetical protein SAMN05421720_105109 [Rhodospira trueperi]
MPPINPKFIIIVCVFAMIGLHACPQVSRSESAGPIIETPRADMEAGLITSGG